MKLSQMKNLGEVEEEEEASNKYLLLLFIALHRK
jgi:hypothetical protein